MHGPGESLKQEREARGKTIEEMAEATGIRLHLLTALEQEAFDSLPGRGFGKLYIRAYAEVLGFDPQPVIEAYDSAVRVRQAAPPPPAPACPPRPVKTVLARWRQELMIGRAGEPIEGPVPVDEAQPQAGTAPEVIEGSAEAEADLRVPLPTNPVEELIEEVPAAPPLPVEAVSLFRPAQSTRWLVASLLFLVLLPLMAYLVFLRSKPDAPRAVVQRESVPGEAAEAARAAPRTQTPVRGQTAPSSLRVAESGVGLRLVGSRLEGEGDHFRSGQRVTFATRVLGGGAGESIRHVWLRDGKVEQSIGLHLGGASWRTHSTKTLWRPGAWAVEARDEQGRVLDRVGLTVAP